MAKKVTKKSAAKAAKDVQTPEVQTPEVQAPKKPTLATAVTTDATKPAKKKVVKIDIIRGRMPLALVYSIKFLETGTILESAVKYRTTVGKVDDILKEANFGYIQQTFKPTMDMITAAAGRCKDLKDGKDILESLKAVGIANAEDLIKFDAIKAALRKKTVKKTTDEPTGEPVTNPVNELTDEPVNNSTDESVIEESNEVTEAGIEDLRDLISE